MSKKKWENREGLVLEKLSSAEVEKIVNEIGDPRLRGDEDEEHFTIKTNDKTYFVAKHRFIPLVENGRVRQVKIKDYLRDLLGKIDSPANVDMAD